LNKLPAFEGEAATVAWFYRVLRNAVIDHYRRGGASERALSGLAHELAEPAEPDHDARNTLCRCVGSLSATLKPEYSEALRRIEVDGLSVQEFAAEAKITSNNAGVRVFRAREALRKLVVRSCGTCAAQRCLDCTCAAGHLSGRGPSRTPVRGRSGSDELRHED
jgi:RNA polymerase sigma factor (sigma-70 family)